MKNQELTLPTTGNKYKNEEQLAFFESLCNETYRFYHVVEETYPEIEVYIEKRKPAEELVSKCVYELKRNGFTGTKRIQVSTRAAEYNELVFTVDLRHLDYQEMSSIFEILHTVLHSYATPEIQHKQAEN